MRTGVGNHLQQVVSDQSRHPSLFRICGKLVCSEWPRSHWIRWRKCSMRPPDVNRGCNETQTDRGLIWLKSRNSVAGGSRIHLFGMELIARQRESVMPVQILSGRGVVAADFVGGASRFFFE